MTIKTSNNPRFMMQLLWKTATVAQAFGMMG
jgi:hypothetical protein